tara:strand:+ start:1046 stop:1420 length:375 start_codon:yes stop_codon:yes gene_type:complete
MSLKDIFEKIQSTLKEIGANIVNFDLTNLLPVNWNLTLALPIYIMLSGLIIWFIWNRYLEKLFKPLNDWMDNLENTHPILNYILTIPYFILILFISLFALMYGAMGIEYLLTGDTLSATSSPTK